MGIFGSEKKQAEEAPGLHQNMKEKPGNTDAVVLSDETEAQLAAKETSKHILTEPEAYESLGFCYPTWKKWTILSVIFAVQCSMNFNTSIYANALDGLTEEFNISEQAGRCGQMIYLVLYGIACELWAPWSEDYGRWPIMQLSLFLVNVWVLPCALAPNFGVMMFGRAMGGLSSAGGSVTLGMVADMWQPDDQGYAVAFVVFSSVGGSVLGPIVGPILAAYADWRWCFWIQLIFGGVVQLAHFFLVPETRSTILLDREAKRRRKNGEPNVYGPEEVKEKRIDFKELMTIWARPFIMLVTEPIVLFLSLLSGFSDALIFTFFESFSLVYGQWGFKGAIAATQFIPIIIGYCIAYGMYVVKVWSDNKKRENDPTSLTPESRLWLLLFLAPLEPIGLFIFAWTSSGPPLPWIAPMIGTSLIAAANLAIYQGTIDYMVAAYGPYSSSATGGNAFCRDVLAGISAMYAIPLYSNLGTHSLEWASTLLAFIAIIVVVPLWVFYYKGPEIRARSKFAMSLADEREAKKMSRFDVEKQNTRAEVSHRENQEEEAATEEV